MSQTPGCQGPASMRFRASRLRLWYNRAVKVSTLGEFGLIDLLARVVGEKPLPSGVVLGIGDDTAAWQGGGMVLATTDTLVEGVHFSLDWAPWRDLGWKALAVNLSDIAAMGGFPRYALVTLALHADTEAEDVEELYRGLMEAAGEFGVAIVGGDVVRAPVVMLTVALWGDAPSMGANGMLRRDAARPGDAIAVTGHLGASAAGLRILQGQAAPIDADPLRQAHLRPQPRITEGQLLWRQGVRAAIDISDGLVADLGHICQMSGVGARIYVEALPVHPLVKAVFGDEAINLALGGGEDYELLFTAPLHVLADIRDRFPISIIGEIVAGPPGQVVILDDQRQEIELEHRGWDHLA